MQSAPFYLSCEISERLDTQFRPAPQRKGKAVAFDFPQDHCIRFFLTGEARPPLPEHVTHYRLLARGVIMFEYLCNMGALTQARNQVVGLPIKIPDSDGAPARVIAMEDTP